MQRYLLKTDKFSVDSWAHRCEGTESETQDQTEKTDQKILHQRCIKKKKKKKITYAFTLQKKKN